MNFQQALEIYKQKVIFDKSFTKDQFRLETHVESLKDWSEIMNISEVKKLFKQKQKECEMSIKTIPLNNLNQWTVSKKTGNIRHKTGNFFSILGLNISGSKSREIGNIGWEQPILREKNSNGGILGIIRKRMNGIPYYLIDFKAEPGNPDLIQISPCLQATHSNIKQSHGGRKPYYSEFFLDPKKEGFSILFDQLMSEDGGRFYKKRNRGMIIQCDDDKKIDLKTNYYWLSLFQIKFLIKNNSWVNPHVRSIISHL